jgi:hypothetical protein
MLRDINRKNWNLNFIHIGKPTIKKI